LGEKESGSLLLQYKRSPMTGHFVRKFQTLSVVILFIAVATILATLASMAQVRKIDQASAGSSLMSSPAQVIAAAEALQNPLPPLGTGNAQHRSASGVQRTRAASAAPDSGNPLFLPAANYGTTGAGTSVAVADVNGDGKPDLLVATVPSSVYVHSSVNVLLGNGDGTFQAPVAYDSGGFGAFSVAVADVNGDGKPDLVVANVCGAACGVPSEEGSVGVLLGNGDGTFQPAVIYDSGGISPVSIAVADLNGDGKLDLVVANQCVKDEQCNPWTEATVSVLLGNGDGTFQTAVSYDPGGAHTESVAVADVNGDGKPDLVAANACVDCGPASVGVLLGNGDGTFQPAVVYDVPAAGWVAIADVNGDGKQDLVVAGGDVCVLMGNGDGTFQIPVCDDTGGGDAISVAVADVNGDGKPDLLVANNWCCDHLSYAGVLLGNGDGTFQPALTYATSISSVAIAAADVNGDGRPDLLLANEDSDGVSVLLNNTGPHIPTATTLASSVNPAMVNQTVTYTATVTGQSGVAVTGTVTFSDGGAAIYQGTVALVNGQAEYSTPYGKRGTHAIAAAYSGDFRNGVSTSATLTEVIAILPVPSTTALTTSGSPSSGGQPVIFTATVTSIYGAIPNGELVTFHDNGAAVGTGTTEGGIATFTTSSLTAKTHTIKAVYSGDGTFKASSGSVTQVVGRYATTTAVVSNLNPSTYGQTITFRATVASTGSNIPTGTVKFGIGSALLSGGVATLTKTWLKAGSYALTAEYEGDSDSAPSTSSVLEQVVNAASTTTTISSSANPSSSGQTVTFTAKVTSSTGVGPSGTITFTAGTTTLGTVAVSVGSISTAALPVGSTKVTATYNGATDFTGSSGSLLQTVN
jgi:hypothetical protein